MRHALVPALVLAAAIPAHADDMLAGKDMLTSPHGQPLCDDQDALHDYLAAMINQDIEAMKRVDGCAMLKPGLPVRVLEDVPSGSGLGHVVRLEAIRPGERAVGYTVSFGLQPK